MSQTQRESLKVRTQDVVVADSETKSAVIDLKGGTPCGISVPSGFDGTAISFEGCATASGTFLPVYDNGGDYSITAAASKYLVLDPLKFTGLQYIKLVAGTSQTGDTTLTLHSRPWS